jgi:hypothetical protein
MSIGMIGSGAITKQIMIQTFIRALNESKPIEVVGVIEKPITFEIHNYPKDYPAEPLILSQEKPWKERTKKQYKNKLKKNKRR